MFIFAACDHRGTFEETDEGCKCKENVLGDLCNKCPFDWGKNLKLAYSRLPNEHTGYVHKLLDFFLGGMLLSGRGMFIKFDFFPLV